MSAIGSFGSDLPMSPEQQLAGDRWEAASDPDTPEETMLRLASDSDPQVAVTLAGNIGASALVLTTLCRHYPEVEEIARLNRNAPPEMKDRSPLSEQSEDSLTVYLDQRKAAPEHRARFIQCFRTLRAPGGPTVADVFEATKTP